MSDSKGETTAASRKKKPLPKGWKAYTESDTVPVWVTVARSIMVVAFCATIPMIIGIHEGRRLFWAACIAILPVFWVAGGFHLWRRICPLAVVSLFPKYLGFAGERRFTKSWLADHYFHMQFGLMIVALTLRLVATNGTIMALIAFIVFVIIAAITVNALYTGKTWCNYICPVGMVEKFYTEPSRVFANGAWAQPNSQCTPCTGCKKNCPDIDLEQGYWKEIDGQPRRTAYYSWPGLVFGFYFYYYLFAGNWTYYFSGIWTKENNQIERLFDSGFYFMDRIPVIVAAPLTLIAFCAFSYAIFSTGERLALAGALKGTADIEDETEKKAQTDDTRKLVRHRTLVFAGYVGFIIFYFYGGQPTIQRLPGWFGEIFAALVVIAATMIFIRRWGRTEEDFVKQRFAEKLLKRWTWGDKPKTQRWQDIVVVHEEREKNQAERLVAYKDSIREMVADGIVTPSEMSLLEGLRKQLGITEKQHRRVLGELNEEEQQLFDRNYQGSVELRLQQNQYRNSLENALLGAARAGRLLTSDELAALRTVHQADPEEEAELLEEFLADDGPVAELVARDAKELHKLADAHSAAWAGSGSGSGAEQFRFLAYICRWRATQRLDHALTLIVPLVDADLYQKLRKTGLRIAGPMKASLEPWTSMLEAIGDSPPPVMRPHVEAIKRFASCGEDSVETNGQEISLEPILALLDDISIYVRAATFDAISRRGDDEAVGKVLKDAVEDGNPLIRETVRSALSIPEGIDAGSEAAAAPTGGSSSVPPWFVKETRRTAFTTLDKMRLLRRISLFERLDPDDLEMMTAIVREEDFRDGENLIREGELDEKVYVIIEGEVEVWTNDVSGSRVVLDTNGSNTCVGEIDAFDRAPRKATITATRTTKVLAIEADAIKSLLATRPAVSRSVIELLLKRLQETFDTVKSGRAN
ncbi:MAG: cyclic nucleotide-binding domain-containing protein [Verrucomicrobiota bacterium]